MQVEGGGFFFVEERRDTEHTAVVNVVVKLQCADGAGMLHGGALQSRWTYLMAFIWYE